MSTSKHGNNLNTNVSGSVEKLTQVARTNAVNVFNFRSKSPYPPHIIALRLALVFGVIGVPVSGLYLYSSSQNAGYEISITGDGNTGVDNSSTTITDSGNSYEDNSSRTTNNSSSTVNNNITNIVANAPPPETTGGSPLSQEQKEQDAAQRKEKAEANPNDPVAQVDAAEAARRAGDLEAAEHSLERARALEPDLPEAEVVDALIRKDRGDIEGATRQLDELPDTAEYASAQLYLGFSFIDQENWRAAEGAFRKAVELAPDVAFHHVALGAALYGQGKYEQAITSHKIAIRLDPDLAMAHNNLGGALDSQGKYEQAIASYKTAIRLDPDLAMAHNNLGGALGRQGKYEQAIASYKTAIRLDPDDVKAHTNLGVTFIIKHSSDIQQGKKMLLTARSKFFQAGEMEHVESIDLILELVDAGRIDIIRRMVAPE